jgi:ABC-type transport system substrate-binding protein
MSTTKRTLLPRPLGRRRFLAGSAVAAAGTATLATFGCGDGDDEPASATSDPSATAAPRTAAPAGPQRGGVLRQTSANAAWDTFDQDRSRFTPVAVVYGHTNDGILEWTSYERVEMGGALAADWEQPDPLTLILRLRDGVTWTDRPPVNGRAVTAGDLAAFILRNRDSALIDGTVAPDFWRTSLFSRVASAEATDEATVQVKFSEPDPLFLNALACANGKVMAPEAVAAFEADFTALNAAHVIGTGGFELTEFLPEGRLKVERSATTWRETWLDGVEWFPLFTDLAAQQAGFEAKELDRFAPTNPRIVADILGRYEGQMHEVRSWSTNPVAGTYAAHGAPWSDPRLIGAIFRALDRRAIVEGPVQGLGAITGNIPPPQAQWAIPERELVSLPGYLEDRTADEAEARQLWDAGGGPALGEVIVDIPDIFEGLWVGISELIVSNLQRVLGNSFKPVIQPYATINEKILAAKYGNGAAEIWYGWIAAIPDVDPSLLLYQSHNSESPQWQQFGLKTETLDRLTAATIREFSLEGRFALCKDIQRELLRNNGAGLQYAFCASVPSLFWNYVHYDEIVPFATAHQVASGWWFDQSDPSWQGRP